MDKIVIIGHKNPDSDSIISAIVGVEFFFKSFGKEAVAYRAGELNNETKYILEKLSVEAPKLIESLSEDVSVALVDHNEVGQISEKIVTESIDYIFDHHKLSVKTEKPIFFISQPIGSTCSLLAKMFFERGLEISEINSKLLLVGILSDTLNLTSPTTTEEDRELVLKLNETAKIEVETFVTEMFAAKSNLEGISVGEIINMDYKVFEMGELNVGIAAWETTSPQSVNEKKVAILKELAEKKEVEKIDRLFFMVVDIIRQNCQLYLLGKDEKSLAEKVFGGEIQEEIMILPGVVSRKKQIVPQLTEELGKE
ncbi:MAG: manganese-dependent inorganic pyrophosphatase [Candidatus Moranbacteria bacterium]|nr:manganese-dependent inorganic pyrophosphatase [Candidatus Moranbacteria bacterium]